MSQLALVYDAAHVGASDWDAELSWFRRAVDVVGHKEVAYRLDVQPSNLTDAIHERERKDVKGKWIATVRRMVPDALLIDYVTMLNTTLGFVDPKRRKPLTDAQENRAIRELLGTLAPAVLAIVEKEIGR